MAQVSQREIDSLKAKNQSDEDKIARLQDDIKNETDKQKREVERVTAINQEKLRAEVGRVNVIHAGKVGKLEDEIKQVRTELERRQRELERLARELEDMLKRAPANDNKKGGKSDTRGAAANDNDTKKSSGGFKTKAYTPRAFGS